MQSPAYHRDARLWLLPHSDWYKGFRLRLWMHGSPCVQRNANGGGGAILKPSEGGTPLGQVCRKHLEALLTPEEQEEEICPDP